MRKNRNPHTPTRFIHLMMAAFLSDVELTSIAEYFKVMNRLMLAANFPTEEYHGDVRRTIEKSFVYGVIHLYEDAN